MPSVIIGMAVSLVVMKMGSDMYVNSKRFEAKITQNIEIHTFKQQIANQIDCKMTFSTNPPGGLPANPTLGSAPITANGAFVDILNSDRRIVLSRNGRNIGKFHLRARIEADPDTPGRSRLQIRAVKPKNIASPLAPNGLANYEPDPLNRNVALDWSNPNSALFSTGVPICGKYFVGEPTGSCPAGQFNIPDPNNGNMRCVECPLGETAVGFDRTGNPICSPVANNIDCGSGRLTGAILSNGDVVCVDKNTPQLCPQGQKFSGLNADGTMLCTDLTTDQQCPIGYKQSGTWPNGVVKCALNLEGFASSCASGQTVAGVTTAGAPICRTNFTGSVCGTYTKQIGITTNGDAVCAPILPGNFSCPPGQNAYGIDWRGQPLCTVTPVANKSCPPGYVLNGYDVNSNPSCVSNYVPPSGMRLDFDLSQCNWVQSMNCAGCVASCPNGRAARETRVNFSGGGGGSVGNLEVYCCRLIATY